MTAPPRPHRERSDIITGAGSLLLFALRRERWPLPCWLVGIAALLALQSKGSQSFYGTPEKLAQLRAMMGSSAAAVAMGGPTRLLDTIGGEIVFEISAYLAVVIALLNMFLIGRHTRTDEDAGRAELIRSARVGRRAPIAAALALAALANTAVAATVFVTGVATGLAVHGSLLFGVSLAGFGLTFAALTAVAAQVFGNPRSVYGSVTLALAASYILRAVGDVGNGTVSWLSPIGWVQRTYPFAGDRWWPIALFALAIVLLTAAAFALLERRDFGAGLFVYGDGQATASWALGSPAGLAWRLQRGSLGAWVIGTLVLGLAYGSFADSIEQYIADNPEIAAYLPGGADSAVKSYLALTVLMLALLAAAYGITSALRSRSEELAGMAEQLLAAPVARHSWLAGQLSVTVPGTAAVLLAGGFGVGLAYGLTISDLTQPVRMMGAALASLPAVWLVVSVAVLGFGFAPRVAALVAWIMFGYCVIDVLFAESFNLPGWFGNLSPFAYSPQVPLETATVGPLFGLTVLAVAAITAGALGFRRRDVGY